MPVEKLDHEAIEQPWLFDLAGMAGAREHFQLAVGHAGLEREGARMAAIFSAGENDHRTRDAFVMAFGIGLGQSAELVNDRFRIRMFVALAEHVGEEMRHRCHAKRRAHIFERVAPAVTNSLRGIIIDTLLGEFFGRIIAGADNTSAAVLSGRW